MDDSIPMPIGRTGRAASKQSEIDLGKWILLRHGRLPLGGDAAGVGAVPEGLGERDRGRGGERSDTEKERGKREVTERKQ